MHCNEGFCTLLCSLGKQVKVLFKKEEKSCDIVFIFPLFKCKVKQSLRLELSHDATQYFLVFSILKDFLL